MIVGITGPAASGKSTFCRLLQEYLDAAWLNLDELAKELYQEDRIRLKIRREVSEAAYSPDDEPNFHVLRRLVFYQPEKLQQLESILYPELKKKVLALLQGSKNNRLFLIEGVKLEQAGLLSVCNQLVAVVADRKKQEERLAARGLPASFIQALLSAQPSAGYYYQLADCVIINNGSIDELKNKAEHAASRLIQDGSF